MAKNSILILLAGALIVAATYLVIQIPWAILVMVAAATVILALVKIGDGWRRAFVLTIVAMAIGASHVTQLATIGALLKIGALGLLVVMTIYNTTGHPRVWGSRAHKFTITALSVTAVIAVASTVWSEFATTTLVDAATMVAFVYILYLVSTVRWQDRDALAGDIGAAYWSAFSVLAVGMGMAAVRLPGAISNYSGRWQGIFDNPNLLGMIATLAVGIGIGWALHKKSLLVWVSLTVPLSQVILSQSRTAMIAAIIAGLWVLLRSHPKYTLPLGYVLLTAAVAVTAFGWSLSALFARFGSMDGGDLLNQRTSVWGESISYVLEHPLGAGWATTPDVLTQMNSTGLGSGFNSIHNSYLQLLFELGWVGILPIALLIVAILRAAMVSSPTGLGLGLAATALAGLVLQITESAIFGLGQPYPYIFWVAVLAATLSTKKVTPGVEVNAPEKHSKIRI